MLAKNKYNILWPTSLAKKFAAKAETLKNFI